MVGGTGFFFGIGADEGACFHARHVVGLGAVEIAAGELFLVELDHFAGLAGFLAQTLKLLLRTVNPDDLVGLEKLGHFVEPCEHGLIVCQCHDKNNSFLRLGGDSFMRFCL